MATDLRFTRRLDTSHPVNLGFGEVDAPGQEGALAANVAIRADLVGGATASGVFAATLGLSVVLVGEVVTPSTTPMTAQAGAAWQEGLRRTQQAAAPVQDSTARPAAAQASWGQGSPAPGQFGAAWQESTRNATGPRARWEAGQPQFGQSRSAWQESARTALGPTGWWQEAQRGPDAISVAVWQEVTRVAAQQLGKWQGASGAPLRVFRAPWGEGEPLPVSDRFPWQEAKLADPGVSPPPTPQPPDPEPHICYVPPPGGAVVIEFSQPATVNDTRLEFICDDRPAGGIVVPVKRVYIVQNNVSLVRVSDGANIPVLAMSLSLDVDSWTWGFSASLPGSSLILVGIYPIELEARINGVAYRVLSEDVTTDRVFGSGTFLLQGRGRAAVLDESVLTFGNPAAARTAQQLMADALEFTGWAVTWDLTDWLVPAGVWSHQGSRIGALTAIAAAAGGYVQPHPTADTVRVLPRYPAAPWAWGSLTPDYTLPAAVVQREGIAWSKKPAYNRVFVSGTGAGVLVQVTRDGTAGDVLAPMVTDALITHVDAARQRATAVLSDTGGRADVTLRLPVLAETGIILPGKFVEYVDGSTTRLGLVRSVKVDAGFPEVWQSLGVETHV